MLGLELPFWLNFLCSAHKTGEQAQELGSGENVENAADTLGAAERVVGPWNRRREERDEGPETKTRPRTVPGQDLGK